MHEMKIKLEMGLPECDVPGQHSEKCYVEKEQL